MTPRQREAFAQRILLRRTELFPKMSLQAFCDLAGITRTTLRIAEDPGSNQNPSEKTLAGLARALRTTPEELKDEQRITPDNPLLKDLTEEDLRVAQTYHHADIAVKQRTLGVLQERQLAATTKREITPDIATLAKRFTALPPDQRYVASQLLELLERSRSVDETTLTLAARLQALPDDERHDLLEALQQQEFALQKKHQTGLRGAATPRRKHTP